MASGRKSTKGENSKSKQVRFSELVQASGKPETATLWEKPKPGSPFMKAVRENRVLTVFQKPTGTRKDFGLIGYFPEPFTTFLVFPKKLLAPVDISVVGIKYDLLELPKERSKPHNSIGKTKSSTPKPPPGPSLKKFDVVIVRTAMMDTKISVRAASLNEAEGKAVQIAQSKRFVPPQITSEVKSIIEVPD